MDIRTLRYFLAVAREENISNAAASLHMTQPPLSRAMQELEEELGKKLFIRGNRKITLTEDGLLLRKRAAEIVELVEKTETELSATEEEITGDIYIGGGEIHAMHLIADAATKLLKDQPGIKYHLYSGNADDVAERLEKGLLDFGIVVGSSYVDKYDYLKLPATERWGILMRKDHPLAKKMKIHPEDLKNLPLLTSRQSLVNNEISGWLKKDYEHLNIVGTYNLLYNASLMVESGLGCALCLDNLANTGSESPLCFRPLSPQLDVTIHIVWKKYQFFTKAAEKFLQVLQNELSEQSEN